MITYKKGNVFDGVVKDKLNIVLHVVNSYGGWGSGFVLKIDEYCGLRPQQEYRKWYKDGHYYDFLGRRVKFELGQIQVVPTNNDDLYICNMVGQTKPGGFDFDIDCKTVHMPPIRYESLQECLYRVKEQDSGSCNLLAVKFGSGLAGGDWSKIEKLINLAKLDLTVWEL